MVSEWITSNWRWFCELSFDRRWPVGIGCISTQLIIGVFLIGDVVCLQLWFVNDEVVGLLFWFLSVWPIVTHSEAATAITLSLPIVILVIIVIVIVWCVVRLILVVLVNVNHFFFVVILGHSPERIIYSLNVTSHF